MLAGHVVEGHGEGEVFGFAQELPGEGEFGPALPCRKPRKPVTARAGRARGRVML